MVVLATQTPLTRVLPGPQAAATGVTMSSFVCEIGAGVMACADVAVDKMKQTTAINLIIFAPPSTEFITGEWAAGVEAVPLTRFQRWLMVV
jgi:hypothetical protein